MVGRLPAAGLLAVLACGNGVGAPTTVGTTSTGESSTTGVLGSTSDAPTGHDGTTGATAVPGTETVSTTAVDIGGDDVGTCDPWRQDCPVGQKCVWYAHGSILINSTKCVPVVPDPDQAGEACGISEVSNSGLDSCDVGLSCADVHDDGMGGLVGTCMPLCMGTPDAPICPRGTVCILFGFEHAYGLCLDHGCDPLIQDCEEFETCVPLGDVFMCVLDRSGEAGKVHDPCDFNSFSCDPGNLCVPPAAAAECDPRAAGCCEPFCDTTLPNACPGQGQVCRPYYPVDTAPPEYDDIGVCSLPG